MSVNDFTVQLDVRQQSLSSNVPPESVDGLLIWWSGYFANAGDLVARLNCSRSIDMIATAYRRWGRRLSEKIEGEFAIAIIDPKAATVSLMQDELALRPVFYRCMIGSIEFGTDLVELTEFGELDEIDEEYVADKLVTGDHFGARTPYASIRRLTTGQALEWTPSGEKLIECSTLLQDDEIFPGSFGEVDERFRELVSSAVQSALVPSAPALCELSGGLDSSTVFGFSNAIAPGRISALSTIYSRSKSADESYWISRMLAHCEAPLLTVDGDEFGHCTELPAGRHAEPSLLMLKAAWKRAYRSVLKTCEAATVLTGEGGDAVLYGDCPQPLYLADLLLKGRLWSMWAGAANWGSGERGTRSPLYATARYAIRPAVRYLRGQRLLTLSERVPWLDAGYARKIDAEHRFLKLDDFSGAGNIARASRLQLVMVSARNAGTYYRMLSEDVPFRHPLLNRSLLRFMLSLPHDQRFTPTRDRIVQRRALEKIVAPSILQRDSKGGSSEPWIRGLEDCDTWPDFVTTDPMLVSRGYFDRQAWFAAVEFATVGRFGAKKYFDAACEMEAWLQADRAWRSDRQPQPRWNKLVGHRSKLEIGAV